MSRKGFTLIELLVVIAVIAVLMGILMPALSMARKQARSAACMSQIKQWGLIWSMYTDENDGKFPTGKMPDWQKTDDGAGSPRGMWVTTLQKNIEKHPGLLLCPSAKKQNPDSGHGSFNLAYRHGQYLSLEGEQVGGDNASEERDLASYGLNLWAYSATEATASGGRNPRDHWMSLSKVTLPARVPLFLDSMWKGGGPHWTKSEAISPPSFNGEWIDAGHEMKHFAMKRHSGGVNCLYMDFSVRNVKVRDLWTQKWHRTYDLHKVETMPPSWWGPWLGGGQ
jgi:prepilin-type N-terminal cleavage/methylation domain-containing protein/prepilin-type processing-associated H-X9-DG protein